jgi:transcriptional regulator with XRE-family HTH domain
MLSPDELAIAVGRNVRSLRQERGLGMAELAQRCSIDPCTIRRLETGHSAQLYTLYKVAQALQVEVGDLVNTAPPRRREFGSNASCSSSLPGVLKSSGCSALSFRS